MSYQITITGKNDHILIELRGEVSVEKLFAINGYLYNDPDFIAHPYAVWDISECTIETEITKILKFARTLGEKRHFETPGKTAFIVTDHELEKVVEPFVELIDDLEVEFKAFNSRITAVQWISQ